MAMKIKGEKHVNKDYKNKRTSIGNSVNSRPNHKHASRKKYRGQGK